MRSVVCEDSVRDTGMHISQRDARLLALTAARLNTIVDKPCGEEGTRATIEALGYVQLDTIHVVERAHHHVLWTRVPDYTPHMLHQLLSVHKTIFEYWGHAASLLPMQDYRYTLPRKQAIAEGRMGWVKRRRQQAGPWLERVLERIRAEGPLSSKDFTSTGKRKGGTWWDWKPAKLALELLFQQGTLMVSERKNFQKVYDLTERVLPEDVDTCMPSREEHGRFLVKRALASLGIAQSAEIFRFLHAAKNSPARDVFEEMLEEGAITPVGVGQDNADSYILPGSLAYVDNTVLSEEIQLLSPFDPLLIQRGRLKRLFNYAYTLECYLPREKRKYGYFVLPLLTGTRFVGRLDARADRKRSCLQIRGFWLEKPGLVEPVSWLGLGERLKAFCHFNHCTSIELGEAVESAHAAHLLEGIHAAGGSMR